MGPLSATERWRAVGGGVSVILGANVWVTLCLYPVLFRTESRAALVLLSLCPLLPLTVGAARHSASLLLLAFPLSLLLPLALAPNLAAHHFHSGWRFALVQVGLVGYLFAAAALTTKWAPPSPESNRLLSSAKKKRPSSMRRRARMYAMLAALAIAFPMTLLYKLNFDGDTEAFLVQTFPGRASSMLIILNLLLLAAWGLLFRIAWLGVLRPHRRGDPALLTELAQLKSRARTRALRLTTFLALLALLVGLAALLSLRISVGTP